MPTVSVIVPAYNAENYIEECVKALLSQTLDDIELIFINDGSTDRTSEIIDKLIKGHDNAHLYNQENKGLYKTRENGLSKATGEYVGWCDADDFVSPQMYEKLYQTAVKNNSDLAYCDYEWFPKKIKTKEKWFREFHGKADVNFVERNSQPWNKIVRRELLEKLQVGKYFVTCFDEIYISVLLTTKNPVAVKEKLYFYRVSSGSMSSSYTNVAHYERFMKASEELKKVVQPIIKDSKYWQDYFDYRVIYYILMTMVVAANVGDKSTYGKCKEKLKSFPANQHMKPIMDYNFGKMKSLVIRKGINKNYLLACLICKVAFS